MPGPTSDSLVKTGRLLAAAWWLAGCPQPVVPPQPLADPAEAPRSALQAFLGAEQAQDFQKAYGLLDAQLRARYTPERLAEDHARDIDLAHDKLSRIRAALGAPQAWELEGDAARLPLGPKRSVQLVKEQGAWHVHSLE